MQNDLVQYLHKRAFPPKKILTVRVFVIADCVCDATDT